MAGRPDVQAKAVLAGIACLVVEEEKLFILACDSARNLWTNRAVVHRTADAGPRLRSARRREPSAAGGGIGVRNAFERKDPFANVAADLARHSLRNCGLVGSNNGRPGGGRAFFLIWLRRGGLSGVSARGNKGCSQKSGSALQQIAAANAGRAGGPRVGRNSPARSISLLSFQLRNALGGRFLCVS